MRQVSGDYGIEFSAESFDDQLEAVLGGTWTADVLKAGVVRRSFSILRHFTDLQSADKPFHLFAGCEYNTLTLSVTPNTIVTGAFGVLGQDLGVDTVEPTGATYDASTTDCPFDGFTGEILEGGVSIGIVTEISLSLDNGLEPRPVVGDDKTIRPTISMSNLSGSMTVYFEDSVMLEKFINETSSSITLTLERGGNSYVIDLPNVTYTGGQPDISGTGSIVLTMPFQALYDETSESQVSVTRTIA